MINQQYQPGTHARTQAGYSLSQGISDDLKAHSRFLYFKAVWTVSRRPRTKISGSWILSPESLPTEYVGKMDHISWCRKDSVMLHIGCVLPWKIMNKYYSHPSAFPSCPEFIKTHQLGALFVCGGYWRAHSSKASSQPLGVFSYMPLEQNLQTHKFLKENPC